jgi:hypothetical protein
MIMEFSHYSDAPTVTPRACEQPGFSIKPKGLWVSVDGPDDWPTWCGNESFPLGANRFKITIADGPLILSTSDDVRAFGAEYATKHDPSLSRMMLDWWRVAERWPGLVIAPYQWWCRLDFDTSWYYGWDCASGCIWNPDVITSVERVELEVDHG